MGYLIPTQYLKTFTQCLFTITILLVYHNKITLLFSLVNYAMHFSVLTHLGNRFKILRRFLQQNVTLLLDIKPFQHFDYWAYSII